MKTYTPLAMLRKILEGIERGKIPDQTLLSRDEEEIKTRALSDAIRDIIEKYKDVLL